MDTHVQTYSDQNITSSRHLDSYERIAQCQCGQAKLTLTVQQSVPAQAPDTVEQRMHYEPPAGPYSVLGYGHGITFVSIACKDGKCIHVTYDAQITRHAQTDCGCEAKGSSTHPALNRCFDNCLHV